MIQDNLFNYRNFVFLRLSIALAILGAAAYLLDQPDIVAYGGTYLGYGLGTVGALIILWLMWLGVRKRQYAKPGGNVRGWVSAHVYLGLSLIVIATLHTGFQVGWNVHTLAYVLMMIVIFSGIWGLSMYISYPQAMSETLNRKSPEQIIESIEALDKDAEKQLKKINDDALGSILRKSASQGIFNSSAQRRSGMVADCRTSQAAEFLKKEMAHRDQLIALYNNQVERLRNLQQLRRYFRMRYWLDLWLAVHVPVSFALLAALTTHVVSVFFYW